MYNPQLETFIKVADAGSFNKAAEQSFITATAVIKQINLLETALGVALFDRTHRGLTLTKAGNLCIGIQNILFNIAVIPLFGQRTPCSRTSRLFVSVPLP